MAPHVVGAIVETVEMAIDTQIETWPVIDHRRTGVEVPREFVGRGIFLCRRLSHGVVIIEGGAVVEGEHGHGEDAEEPTMRRHPVVGIARPHTYLCELHLTHAPHIIGPVPVGAVGVIHTAMMIHRPHQRRTSREALDERLIVGGGIREALAVEEVVAVEEERTHPDGVFGRGHELRHVAVVGTDAEVDTIAATRGTQGEGRAITACQLF